MHDLLPGGGPENIRNLTAAFDSLMPHRVHDILVVASSYDAFVLEEGGRLTELILNEYVSLNLTYAPSITRASSAEEALQFIKEKRFNLVLSMMWSGSADAFAFGSRVKKLDPKVPVVMLAFDAREVQRLQLDRSAQGYDEVFTWTGDTGLFLAIIKLFEDRWNVDHDTSAASVRTILLIEDSVRFTSLYLPLLYTELMKQTQSLMDEGINVTHRLLRMRARPKILLARTFEEAESLFKKYKRYMLGVISDVRFPRGGEPDTSAGVDFVRKVREEDPTLPVVMQSSQENGHLLADSVHAHFINKRSRSLLTDLQKFIEQNFGFGDFIFRLPDGTPVGRAHDLRSLEEQIQEIPDTALEYHATRNDFSNWLRARTEFGLASLIRPRRVSEFSSMKNLRRYLVKTFSQHRAETQRGVIADFSPRRFDEESSFVRIGRGSLGGKGRGLAFANHLLLQRGLTHAFPGVRIAVPSTAVIGTDVFDAFLAHNDLYEIAFTSNDDQKISQAFLAARLPRDIQDDLASFLERVDYPLAVRSSSLLEDSQFQPFAGIYRTYMVPNNHAHPTVRLAQLSRAIKLVYASTFSSASKKYMENTPYRVEDEKMAVILQRLVGSVHGTRFYPNFSGVARSHNFYPIPPMQHEEGLAVVALGLGRQVVSGADALRFSPAHPRHIPEFGSTENTLQASQRKFYALDLAQPHLMPAAEEETNLLRLGIAEALEDGTLQPVASTYSPQNDAIYEGMRGEGIPLITFAPILKTETFPLAAILRRLLALGKKGMGSPVEMEFAVDLHSDPAWFGFLQIRRLVVGGEPDDVRLDKETLQQAVLYSAKALGNGVLEGITDFVYVDPRTFDSAHTRDMAAAVAKMNQELRAENRPYVLIGPGRWGSSDPWLGIPVSWEQISQARVIVEAGLKNFRVTPSQGTHFFQNITSLRIGYFTVNENLKDGRIDWDWMASQSLISEENGVRHVRAAWPARIMVDGQSGRGAIFPGHEELPVDDEESGT